MLATNHCSQLFMTAFINSNLLYSLAYDFLTMLLSKVTPSMHNLKPEKRFFQKNLVTDFISWFAGWTTILKTLCIMCLAESGVRSMFGRWGCVHHYNGRSEKFGVGQWTWKFQSFVKILMILGMQHPVKQARIKFGLEDYRAHTCTEHLTGTGTCRKEGTWSL